MKKKMTEQNGAAAGRCGNRGLSGHSLDDPLLAKFDVKCLRSRYSWGCSFEIFQTSRESEKVLAFDPSVGLTIAVQKATVVVERVVFPLLQVS
jgi:hypothetical protein